MLDFGPLAPLYVKMTSSTKPEVHIVLQFALSSAHVTCGNMCRKFGELWTCVSQICERTDRHTDTLIAILLTPIAGEVTNTDMSFCVPKDWTGFCGSDLLYAR